MHLNKMRSILKLCLLVGFAFTLIACQQNQSQEPTPDPAFAALDTKQQVLLQKMMKSYVKLFQAVESKRLSEMQLYAGGISEAAQTIQFSLDLESSGAIAMIHLSAQQIVLTRSPKEASQQFEDLNQGLTSLLKRFPRLADGLEAHNCTTSDGQKITWLHPILDQAEKLQAPYAHKLCK